MPRYLQLPSLALAAALAAACSSVSADPVSSPASTARTGTLRVTLAAPSFTRGASGVASVEFAVENDSTSPVGVVQCGTQVNPAVERWDGGQWAPYAGGFCLAIYPVRPVPLEPGARREGAALVSDAGRYRLVVPVESGQVASAPFEVK